MGRFPGEVLVFSLMGIYIVASLVARIFFPYARNVKAVRSSACEPPRRLVAIVVGISAVFLVAGAVALFVLPVEMVWVSMLLVVLGHIIRSCFFFVLDIRMSNHQPNE